MTLRLGKLNKKLLLAILAVWIPILIFDIFSAWRETRSVTFHEINRWTHVVGEAVRVGLNTLMREGKMDARFSMFANMREEITGLESVRVIRGPRVNEIFKMNREQKELPKLEKSIQSYQADLADQQQQLAEATDEGEKADIQDEIDSINESIASMQDKIAKIKATQYVVDPREAPKDDYDRQVLRTGEQISLVDGDRMRVISPFKVRKQGCTEASGCHQGAKPDEVLGAMSMEFSIAEVNEEILVNTLLLALAKGLIGLFIVIAVFTVVNLVVVKHIKSMLAAFRRMGEGDLSVRLPTKGDDEIQELARGINAFTEQFGGVLRRLVEGTVSLSDSSTQLAKLANDIAQGADEQTGKAISVANSATEMSATAQDMARMAQLMATSSHNATETAAEGQAVVGQTIDSMKAIASASTSSSEGVTKLVERAKGIDEILTLIDGIANQTNLLALNAAIEAARAGDQGRGFAVVADEVRKLAEQTARATKDVSEMVRGIRNDASGALHSLEQEMAAVNNGARLSEHSREALDQISTHINAFYGQIEQMAAATEQQSVTADHITGDINEVARITGEAGDNAREIAHASDRIATLAADLKAVVGRFQL